MADPNGIDLDLEADARPPVHQRVPTDPKTRAWLDQLVNAGLAVPGNTFPVKSKLSQIGCKWYQERKQWIAPNKHVLKEAIRIVADAAPERVIEDRVAALQLSRVPDGKLLLEVQRRGLAPGLPILNEEELPTIEAVERAFAEAEAAAAAQVGKGAFTIDDDEFWLELRTGAQSDPEDDGDED